MMSVIRLRKTLFLAHVNPLLRHYDFRQGGNTLPDQLVLNDTNQTVSLGFESLRLSGKASQLLQLLALSRGKVVERESLAKEIWSNGLKNANEKQRYLDITDSRLRHKLIKLGGLLGKFPRITVTVTHAGRLTWADVSLWSGFIHGNFPVRRHPC